MKHYNLLIVAALVGLSLSSCAWKESIDTASMRRFIRFTSNLNAYATRATDTDFEAGDEVSLFARTDGDLVSDNVKMTFVGNELVPEHDVCWGENQPDSVCAEFFAVYPYREDWEMAADLAVFSVNADQSTRELYAASDLLAASYLAYPDCETVPLNFTHRLCKFSVYVHDADSVSRVYLSGVYGKSRLMVSHAMPVRAVGEKGDINMYAAGGGDSKTPWSAIIPPQEMDFKVVVELKNGKQYAFAPSSGNDVTVLQSAYEYNTSVSLDYASEADYYVQVRDWTADNDSQFGEYVSDRYHTEGAWYLRTNGSDMSYMNDNGLTNWFANLVFAPDPSAMYELVYRIASHEYVYGLPEEGAAVTPCDTLSLVEGGKPFRINANADCIVSIDPYSNALRLAVYDEKVYLATSGAVGYEMCRTGTGLYTIDFGYWGEDFYFTGSSGWTLASIGIGFYPAVWQLYTSGRYYCSIESSGKYRISLNVNNLRLKIESLAEYVPAAYAALLGDWTYTKDDGTVFDISIKSSGYGFDMTMGNRDFYAKYDNARSRMVIPFQKVREWYWSDYSANVQDWLCAGVGEGQASLGYEGEDLMYCTVSEDGSSIEVTPVPKDNPTNSYYLIALFMDGTYAGYCSTYWDKMPLPQVWSKK